MADVVAFPRLINGKIPSRHCMYIMTVSLACKSVKTFLDIYSERCYKERFIFLLKKRARRYVKYNPGYTAF